MKKRAFLLCYLLLGVLLLAGCSASDTSYVAKSYVSKEEQISEVRIDVRDAAVEITRSADEQIHIAYFESDTEYYNISVSEENILTMTAASNKKWTDFIGRKAAAEVRKISIQLPDAQLKTLSVSTTNENISVAPLTLTENIMLHANGGNIAFTALDAGSEIRLDVKNGNISGTISGSADDYAISCAIKKGESNLPSDKRGGSKKLSVTANNGDVTIDIQ